MKKTALLLAALCACALAKDYEYALESTSQKIYEEPALSYVTRQIYDAKARKTQVVTESELKDGGKNRYKEVSYFGKDGELVKFYAYDYLRRRRRATFEALKTLAKQSQNAQTAYMKRPDTN